MRSMLCYGTNPRQPTCTAVESAFSYAMNCTYWPLNCVALDASQGIRWNNNVNSRTMQKSSFWAVSCVPCIQSCKRSGIASSLPCNIWSLWLVKHANPWNVSYNCRDSDKMEAYAAERFEFMAWRLKSLAFRGIVSCTWTGGLKVFPAHASVTEGSRRQSRRNTIILKSPKFIYAECQNVF